MESFSFWYWARFAVLATCACRGSPRLQYVRLQRAHYLGGVVFLFGGNEHLLAVAFPQLVVS